MKLSPSTCIKCGTTIIKNGKPLSNYRTLAYKTAGDNILCIGFCKKCKLEPREYKLARKAVAAFQGQCEEIKEFIGGDSVLDKMCEPYVEAPVCHKCKNKIKQGEGHVRCGTLTYHEFCKEKKPHGRSLEKVAPGKASKKNNKRNPRVSKNV